MELFSLFIVVAIVLSSVPLSLFYVATVAKNRPSYFNSVILIYMSAIAILAYCLTPNYINDLTRYFQMLDYCHSLPAEMAFTWEEDGLVVKNALFWLIAQTGDYHLLPALSTSVLYGVSAYITADSLKNHARLLEILTVQALAIPFFSSVCNIRNVFAFSVILYAAYRDLVKKKWDPLTIACYTLPCFIHMTGIVLVVIRVIVFFVKRFPKIGVVSTIVIPSLTIRAYSSFRNAFSRIPGGIGKILNRALWKAYASTMSTSEYAQTAQSSGFFNAGRIVIVCIAVSLILCILIDSNKNKISDFTTFGLLICGITTVWGVLSIVKYWVFGVAMVVIAPAMISDILNSHIRHNQALLLYSVPLLALARFALETHHMIPRIDAATYCISVLTTNVFSILFSML